MEIGKIEINSSLLAWILIISSIIGLTLDIYEVPIFGDVGLGLVFGPAIGLILYCIFLQIKSKKITSKNNSDR